MQQRFWRGLITALAIGFTTKLFGVIGCIVVATIMAILWRWPRPQVITASVFAGVCFVASMLLKGYPPASLIATPATSTAQTVTVPQQPTNPSPTDWNRVASTFEVMHPVLKYGQNTQIMQSKINALAGGRLINEDVLNIAYATAKLDPGWTPDATRAATQDNWSANTRQPTVDPKATWDADVRAFIAAHPDLQYDENLEIMDGYTRALTRTTLLGYDNATILAIAYAQAKNDPRWAKHDIVISMHG